MKIEANRDSLLKSISIADSIISSKNVNTILSNCIFKVLKNSIEIVSTDNEIGIRTRMNANTDSDFSFMTNGRKLSSIIKELPMGDVMLEINDSYLIDIKSKGVKGRYTLIGSPVVDYPDVPEFKDEHSIEIEQAVLRDIIQKVIYAAATDSIKPVFNSVYFITESAGNITTVASDIKRLTLVTTKIGSQLKIDKGIIIPLKTVNEIHKLLTVQGICRIIFDKTQCFFRIGDTDIISRVLDGQFPNFRQVIPQEYRFSAIIQTEKLLDSIKRMIVFTREPSYKINLTLKKNVLFIEAKTPELGEAEEEIEIELDYNEDISIGISAHFLIESLREIDSHSVNFNITSPTSPVVINPEGNNDYISVIMPIQSKTGQGD